MKPKQIEFIVTLEQTDTVTDSENKRVIVNIERKWTQPLIRCKDCKFYEVAELNYDGTPDKRCMPSICANGWYEYAVERDPNWFCADAEPKENGDGDR